MKKILLFICALSSTLFSGCVDKDFDLGKIDDKDIVLGDDFVIPIGNIRMKLRDVFHIHESQKTIIPFQIPSTFWESYIIEGGFDETIVDRITSTGSQSISAEVLNPISNVELLLDLSFENSIDGEKTLVLAKQKIGSGKTIVSADIPKEKLYKMSEANRINVEFNVVGDNRDVMINPDDMIIIYLKLHRKGGIKF